MLSKVPQPRKTMDDVLGAISWQLSLLGGRVQDLETRFASTELARTAGALSAKLQQVSMDAEKAIRTILDAAKEPRP